MAYHAGLGKAGSRTKSPTLGEVLTSKREGLHAMQTRTDTVYPAAMVAQMAKEVRVYEALVERLGAETKHCRVTAGTMQEVTK